MNFSGKLALAVVFLGCSAAEGTRGPLREDGTALQTADHCVGVTSIWVATVSVENGNLLPLRYTAYDSVEYISWLMVIGREPKGEVEARWWQDSPLDSISWLEVVDERGILPMVALPDEATFSDLLRLRFKTRFKVDESAAPGMTPDDVRVNVGRREINCSYR